MAKRQHDQVESIVGISRRHFLLGTLLGPAGLPLLDHSAFASQGQLPATEEAPETENNWEGPFYKPGAPTRSVLLEEGMPGTPLTVTGRVLDTTGRPLKGALLDIWHADHTGAYDLAGFRLRGRLYTETTVVTPSGQSSRCTTASLATCGPRIFTSRQASRSLRC